MTFITYSEAEAAERLGINRRLMKALNETGLLKGVYVTERKRRYSEKQLEEFWQTVQGYNISDEPNMRFTAMMIRKKAVSRE